MQHKGKVCLALGGQYACGGKAVVVDEGGVVAADPLHRVRRVGDDGVKRFVIGKVRVNQRVAQLDVELVVVDVMQEHVHARQVVGGVVEFLPPKTVLNQMLVKVFFGLQQQRAGATGGVVNLVDAGLLVYGNLGNQFGHMLGREELAARLARVGGVVGNQEFVGVAEQVDLVGLEIAAAKVAKVQLGHAFEHGGQAGVFVFDGVAQAVAGGVKVGKQTANVAL